MPRLERRLERRETFRISGHDDEIIAAPGELLAELPPDASRRAGDDGDRSLGHRCNPLRAAGSKDRGAATPAVSRARPMVRRRAAASSSTSSVLQKTKRTYE